jgi:hypothetical protein
MQSPVRGTNRILTLAIIDLCYRERAAPVWPPAEVAVEPPQYYGPESSGIGPPSDTVVAPRSMSIRADRAHHGSDNSHWFHLPLVATTCFIWLSFRRSAPRSCTGLQMSDLHDDQFKSA